MFPDGLCASMANLHADAPAHSWKFTQRQVENSLHLPKGKLFEVFKSFDAKPVASGSIAQVHRAVLRPPPIHMIASAANRENNNDSNQGEGTLVAVKVRHPNVSRLIDMDFRLMGVLADICDRIPSLSWLHVRSSVEQFSHTMAAQAHLHVEAHHLEVLNYNFRKWPDIGFPQPFFASAAVIMETFEKGRIVTDIMDMYDNMALTSSQSSGGVHRDLNNNNNNKDKMTVEEARDGDDDDDDSIATKAGKGDQIWPVDLAKFIVTNGLSLYLKMLLVDNLMHADLHPVRTVRRRYASILYAYCKHLFTRSVVVFFHTLVLFDFLFLDHAPPREILCWMCTRWLVLR
jgi:aarF domain-containing kinase